MNTLRLLVLVSAVLSLPAFAGNCGNGTLLVVNKGEDSLSFIDLTRYTEVARTDVGEGPHEVAVSPDGSSALVSNYGSRSAPGTSLTLLDIGTASVVRQIDLRPYSRPHGIAWLADGKHAVVTAEDQNAVLFIDVTRGGLAQVVDSGGELPHMLSLSPDGKETLVSNMRSPELALFDNRTAKRRIVAILQPGVEGIAVDDQTVWAANRSTHEVLRLAKDTGEVLYRVPVDEMPIRLRLSPDQRSLLVTAALGASVTQLDAETGRLLRRWQPDTVFDLGRGANLGGYLGTRPFPIGTLFSANGNCFFVSASHAGYVNVYAIDNDRAVARIKAGKEPDGLAYSPLSMPPRRP